jgi:hypothetical protein
MKYYDENSMKNLRSHFENQVLSWSKVEAKKTFGCPCYKANGNLFVFLVNKGVVITNLNENDRQFLSKRFHVIPFQANNRSIKKWVKLQYENKEILNHIISYIKQSYEIALNKKK